MVKPITFQQGVLVLKCVPKDQGKPFDGMKYSL